MPAAFSSNVADLAHVVRRTSYSLTLFHIQSFPKMRHMGLSVFEDPFAHGFKKETNRKAVAPFVGRSTEETYIYMYKREKKNKKKKNEKTHMFGGDPCRSLSLLLLDGGSALRQAMLDLRQRLAQVILLAKKDIYIYMYICIYDYICICVYIYIYIYIYI